MLGHCIVLLEELNNRRLIRFLCELERRLVFVINVLGVCSALKQVFNHVYFIALDRIVQWGLFIVVDQVGVPTIGHKLLDHLKVSLPRCVEDWGLPVGVDVVDVTITLGHQIIEEVQFSIARCVVQGSLVQVVRLLRLNAELPEYLGHADSLVITPDLTRLEHGGLFVVSLVEELRDVVDCIVALLQYRVDVPILD